MNHGENMHMIMKLFIKLPAARNMIFFYVKKTAGSTYRAVMACRNLLMPRSRVKITGQSAESMMARVLRKTHGMG